MDMMLVWLTKKDIQKKKKDIQSKSLATNILRPSIVHSLDLLKDMPPVVLIAMTFVGVIQRLYTMFSGYG